MSTTNLDRVLATEDGVPKDAFLGAAEQCFGVATGEAQKLDG